MKKKCRKFNQYINILRFYNCNLEKLIYYKFQCAKFFLFIFYFSLKKYIIMFLEKNNFNKSDTDERRLRSNLVSLKTIERLIDSEIRSLPYIKMRWKTNTNILQLF